MADLRNFRAASAPNATLVVDDMQMDPGLSFRDAERMGLLWIREVYGFTTRPRHTMAACERRGWRLVCVPWGFAAAEYTGGN